MSFKDKNPHIQSFILSMVPDAEGLVTSKRCATCSRPDPTKGIDDEMSKREFEISGMCINCQDVEFDPES